MPPPNLIFIDTNIWLDFYRARNETGLHLLAHTEAVVDKIIVSYQLESEFKKNRQTAICDGMQALTAPDGVPQLGIFSDAKATKAIKRSIKDIAIRTKTLRSRLQRALEKPALHDPVFKVCQRIFHKEDDLNLIRSDVRHSGIRRRAFRRFLHGCAPRKKNETSIGDAFNWEWMVQCAIEKKVGLVIVSRDSDYGMTLGSKSYINDHLRQEFSDRVSRTRSLVLCARLSDALKLFKVAVSPQEEEAEKQLVSTLPSTSVLGSFLNSNALVSTVALNSLLNANATNLPTSVLGSFLNSNALASTVALNSLLNANATNLPTSVLGSFLNSNALVSAVSLPGLPLKAAVNPSDSDKPSGEDKS